MKKHLLFVILALVVSATPLLAQEGTIAAYFTVNEVEYSRFAQYSAFTYDAIVTIHVEDVVRGGSFKLIKDSADISLINETYPPSIQVGSVATGLDIGFYDPAFGFLGEPVVIATATYLNNIYPAIPNVEFEVVAAFENADPVYADSEAVLHPLVGKKSGLGDTVANDDATWGGVKALYR